MFSKRRNTVQRLPPHLARKRDFEVIADARDLETLREALRREVRVHTSLRALALNIGVDRGTLRKFLAMESVPRAENLDKIRDWAADRPELATPLGSVALTLLVHDLPGHRRAHVRRQLAQELAAAFTRHMLPEWLEHECVGHD
jgi:transcriptional regulator with XRE-family HTH domain